MSSTPTPRYFGTDGIRGPANVHPLVPEFATRLAGAAASVLAADGGRVLIVRDPRRSGPMLESALAAGLLSAGLDVFLGGILPTPAASIIGRRRECAFSIVVSASHNPAADNGIKFFGGDGCKLSEEQESAIEAAVQSEAEPARVAGSETGQIHPLEAADIDAYLDFATSTFGDNRLDGLTIAVDAANGAAFETTPAVLTRLGAEVLLHHAEPDGLNINEDCGCTHKECIEQLVRETGADLGLAHDGDADRVLLVDEEGHALDGDEIMGIVALHGLRNGTLGGDTLVATIMSNAGLDAAIADAGGSVLRTDVGDRHVSEAMRKGGHNVGGEQSGHFVFSDFVPTGDGLVSALQVLRVVRETGNPLSELRQAIRLFPQTLLNVPVASKPPLDELVETAEAVTAAETTLAGRGRVMLRYSGTESLLRVLVEGEERPQVEALASQIGQTAAAEILRA